MTQHHLDAASIRALAVKASVDPRSVRRELAEPGSVRGLAGHRIRAVLVEVGIGAVGISSHPLSGGQGPVA